MNAANAMRLVGAALLGSLAVGCSSYSVVRLDPSNPLHGHRPFVISVAAFDWSEMRIGDVHGGVAVTEAEWIAAKSPGKRAIFKGYFAPLAFEWALREQSSVGGWRVGDDGDFVIEASVITITMASGGYWGTSETNGEVQVRVVIRDRQGREVDRILSRAHFGTSERQSPPDMVGCAAALGRAVGEFINDRVSDRARLPSGSSF